MKLVDILARDLKVWPEGVLYAWQSQYDNEIYFEGCYAEIFHATENAEDSGAEGSEVTRAQWQAAVSTLKGAPGQIDEEERSYAIAEMCRITEERISQRSAGILYDAGYRKQPKE